MAATINQAFEKLRENLAITGLQEATVSTRQQNVRDAVVKELEVLDSFLTGSYRRSTMISPMAEADIDIFVVLAAKYYEAGGHASLLDNLKRVLKRTYPSSPDISRDGQAVTITFTDFRVDVVPAFNRQGGGYLIPDSVLKRWIGTDPKKHVEVWSDSNKAHEGDLVPLMKMIKGWNKKHSATMRSFHLETLVLNIFEGVKISNPPSGVRYFFDKARSQAKLPLPDPAGYGGNVAAYLDTSGKIDDLVSRLDTAYTRARDAESLGKDGKVQQAIEKWRLVFGDYFPVYG